MGYNPPPGERNQVRRGIPWGTWMLGLAVFVGILAVVTAAACGMILAFGGITEIDIVWSW